MTKQKRQRTDGDRMTKQQIIELERRAREHIESVPYSVSLRWVFYRLLQDSIYKAKGDYDRFQQQASKFRHDGTWPPDMLTDETRQAITRGQGTPWTEREVAMNLLDPDKMKYYFYQSHFVDQAIYVEIWFEARAMIGQFEHYTQDISLLPFGGMTSIPIKYAAARNLDRMAKKFKKPIVILYFGDSDKAGQTIFDSSTTGEKGFQKWCNTDIEVRWCGLTEAQAVAMGVPPNPDKPGDYQWEALTDDQARLLIAQALENNIDLDLIEKANANAKAKAEILCKKLENVFDEVDLDD
jgi:hypothetical protein